MEVGRSCGREVINAAPGLQGPLLLEGYVRLLHRGYVNVSPVEQQVVALRTQVAGANRPALVNLPFGGEVPLLRYLTGKVAAHHRDGFGETPVAKLEGKGSAKVMSGRYGAVGLPGN